MTFSLFDQPEHEPSQFVGFAGNVIDRQSENRSDDSTEKALADPSARLIVTRGGRLHLKRDGETLNPYFAVGEAPVLKASLAEAVLLGWSQNGPVVAAPAGIEPDDLPDTIKAIDYRSVYMQGLVPPDTLGELAQGGALLAWHANHRYCGRCGAETEMRAGGYKRICTNCDTQHFPRTDPVVIMLTLSGDRCLLGRSPRFAPGMYSCLAGFVEPGETIENAVRRETMEEAGIAVGRIVYHASQPWPFPYSLMIGCYGEALGEDITTDTNELEDCRWFTRGEVRAAIADRESSSFFIPPPGAIASHIIRAWAEQE